MINAHDYGRRFAPCIAGIMFVSLVRTALTMHALVGTLGPTPHGGRRIAGSARIAFGHTSGLDLAFITVAGGG